MASVVIDQLNTFGPEKCQALTYEQAAAYTRKLAGGHYENFSVMSFFVPKALREDFANVYAFCRWADDLGDETGSRARSLELLAWWRRELHDCYADNPRHPVYVALNRTIRKHNIPMRPFSDLIDAFVQDQHIQRYQNWEQVTDYCQRSANPVGRLVLYLCGYQDEQRQQLSDQTCTALQLINFWQDVRRDAIERERIYVPADELAKHDITHDLMMSQIIGTRPLLPHHIASYSKVIRSLVDRTAPMFVKGRQLLPLVNPAVQLPIELFTLGGEAVMKRIRAIDYKTLQQRPRLSKWTKLMLMAHAVTRKLTHKPRGTSS